MCIRDRDKPGALRLFLKIEEKLKNTNEPYYAGLLYGQIGEVYYEQMMIYNYQLSLVLCQQFRSPSLAEGSWQRKQARERSEMCIRDSPCGASSPS